MSNGLCPFAVHRIVPAGKNDPPIKPRVAILHVDAGNAASLEDYFRHRSGGVESHFHVRKDGLIEQYRSIYLQADANYLANDFAVSIETQGYGEGEWTPAQMASIKRLLVWLNAEAGIPLRKCPAWDSSGVGYHIQFGSPGKWTNVAKACPGADRIKQYENELVPWMAKPTMEDDMTEAESRMLREVHGRLFGVTHQRHVKQPDGGYRPAKLLDTKDGSYLVGLILANRFDENSLAELVANKVLAEATGGEVSVETVKQGVREVFAELAVAPE